MAPQRKSFPAPLSGPAEPFRLAGERVFLRPPERGDYEAWASLRARSRNFLAPWEPSWPPDALSRASFRARVARYAEDWRTDQAYNFFIFTHDETLVGGVGLSNLRRGVVGDGEPRLLGRRGLCPAALYDRGAAAGARLSPSSGCGCTGSRPPACRPTSRAGPCWSEPASSRKATPANTSASKASGRTTCCSRSCARIGRALRGENRAIR